MFVTFWNIVSVKFKLLNYVHRALKTTTEIFLLRKIVYINFD